MFEHERTLYDFVLHYITQLSADLDDARLTEQPAPGMNHPAWILGHLALCTDYGAMMLGDEMRCPEAWHKLFGPGSTPTTDRSAYPSKAELLDALIVGHKRVSEASKKADPVRMATPHDVQIAYLKKWIPTKGDLLAHLMTTHAAGHIGQLSAWRRINGMSGVLAY
jgi:hypothetical protein